MDARSAAAITAAATPNPDLDPDGSHYEAWRGAIRGAIAHAAGLPAPGAAG
jgi:hypothetical protein